MFFRNCAKRCTLRRGYGRVDQPRTVTSPPHADQVLDRRLLPQERPLLQPLLLQLRPVLAQ
eukprot:13662989-Heterocapsa_arctica.AAC.1